MENKFLWLCAFIDVLGTLYVGIYEIGSFPSIFLHSYFLRSWCFQPLANLFIEFEPFVKSVMLKQCVCVTKWWNIPQIHGRTATQGLKGWLGSGQHPRSPTGRQSLGQRSLAAQPAPPPSAPLKSEFRCTLRGSSFCTWRAIQTKRDYFCGTLFFLVIL